MIDLNDVAGDWNRNKNDLLVLYEEGNKSIVFDKCKHDCLFDGIYDKKGIYGNRTFYAPVVMDIGLELPIDLGIVEIVGYDDLPDLIKQRINIWKKEIDWIQGCNTYYLKYSVPYLDVDGNRCPKCYVDTRFVEEKSQMVCDICGDSTMTIAIHGHKRTMDSAYNFHFQVLSLMEVFKRNEFLNAPLILGYYGGMIPPFERCVYSHRIVIGPAGADYIDYSISSIKERDDIKTFLEDNSEIVLKCNPLMSLFKTSPAKYYTYERIQSYWHILDGVVSPIIEKINKKGNPYFDYVCGGNRGTLIKLGAKICDEDGVVLDGCGSIFDYIGKEYDTRCKLDHGEWSKDLFGEPLDSKQKIDEINDNWKNRDINMRRIAASVLRFYLKRKFYKKDERVRYEEMKEYVRRS